MKKGVDEKKIFSKPQKIIFCFVVFTILASILVFSTTTISDSLISSVNSTFSGFVGIGTLTPNSTLAVVGNASVAGNLSAQYFLGNGAYLTNIPTYNATYNTWAYNHTLSAMNIMSANDTAINNSVKLALTINSTATIGQLYNVTASMIANLSITQLNWTFSQIANTTFTQNFTSAAVQALINNTNVGFLQLNATLVNAGNLTMGSGSIIKMAILANSLPDCVTSTNHSLGTNASGLYYCSSNSTWAQIMLN